MTKDAGQAIAALRDNPLGFGVGARITISTMTDRFVEVIVDALAVTESTGLTVRTGDVSTYVGGSESDLLRYVTDLSATVAGTGAHTVISLHLSRGCPGEVVCELPGGVGPRAVDVPAGRTIGRFASAEWALYPLADDVHSGVGPDHMRDIAAAIELSRSSGTFRGSEHFVTRLEGDLGTILTTVFAGWIVVGRTVQHVTSHLTVSVNSPNHAGA